VNRVKRTSGFCILLALLCLALPASGQQSWEKKEYRQWSKADVARILDDSPWAQTQYESPKYIATIRLRSALPIRQALVRIRQLTVNYDKLGEADRARFDSEVKEFLECPSCARYYLVTLVSPITTFADGRSGLDAVGALKGSPLEALKPHVYLTNDRGERRYLAGFIPAKGEGAEAVFVFPRLDDRGRPFLTPENKRFSFTIEDKILEKLAVPLKKFTFEVSRIVRNGEVIF
jgi:hypothetical protein